MAQPAHGSYLDVAFHIVILPLGFCNVSADVLLPEVRRHSATSPRGQKRLAAVLRFKHAHAREGVRPQHVLVRRLGARVVRPIGRGWFAMAMCVVSSVSHAQTPTPERWVLTRADVAVVAVPSATRDQLDDLEYDDTSSMQGAMVDLNGDGVKDYIIQSAPSLCGNGGCDYAIVDGASNKSLGTIFGGTLVVGGAAAHGFPVIETISHLSAESVTDATYAFDGSSYVQTSTRVVSGASLDSLDTRLGALPRFRR